MQLLHALLFLCLSFQVLAREASDARKVLERSCRHSLYNDEKLNQLAYKALLENELNQNLGTLIRNYDEGCDVYLRLTGDADGPVPGIQEIRNHPYNAFGYYEKDGQAGVVLLVLKLKINLDSLPDVLCSKFGLEGLSHNLKLDKPACDRVNGKGYLFEEDLKAAFDNKKNEVAEFQIKNPRTAQDFADQVANSETQVSQLKPTDYGICKCSDKNEYRLILGKLA